MVDRRAQAEATGLLPERRRTREAAPPCMKTAPSAGAAKPQVFSCPFLQKAPVEGWRIQTGKWYFEHTPLFPLGKHKSQPSVQSLGGSSSLTLITYHFAFITYIF